VANWNEKSKATVDQLMNHPIDKWVIDALKCW
jgi:hypothetical protein